GMAPDDLAQLEQQLAVLFQDPQVKDWFSSAWEAKQEKAILMPSGQVLRPDRVLVRGDQAVVIDFKTGGRHSHHPEQV
ncbi:MAG: hypothetical protein GWN58_54195, partial [Anaerolineae bacterium]|nr:hypothetical protein [Anaerolineae bacterium]